jgi:hypothetical protein
LANEFRRRKDLKYLKTMLVSMKKVLILERKWLREVRGEFEI